jgi:hypothetical protein
MRISGREGWRNALDGYTISNVVLDKPQRHDNSGIF